MIWFGSLWGGICPDGPDPLERASGPAGVARQGSLRWRLAGRGEILTSSENRAGAWWTP